MCIISTFFVQLDCSFLRLLLFLTLMSKSEKILEMNLDLVALFKTCVDARVEGLVSNLDYL